MYKHETTSQRDPLRTAYGKFVDAVRETLDVEAGLLEVLRQAPSVSSDIQVTGRGEDAGAEAAAYDLVVASFGEFVDDVRQTLDIEAGLREALGRRALASSYTELVGDISETLDIEGGLDAGLDTITPGSSPAGGAPAGPAPAFVYVPGGADGTGVSSVEEVASYLVRHGDSAVRFRLRESIDLSAWNLLCSVRSYAAEDAGPARQRVERVLRKVQRRIDAGRPRGADEALLESFGMNMTSRRLYPDNQPSDKESVAAAELQCFEELNEAIGLVEHQVALFENAVGREVPNTSRVNQYGMLYEELRTIISVLQSSVHAFLVRVSDNGTLKLIEATFGRRRSWPELSQVDAVFPVTKRLATLAAYKKWLDLLEHDAQWCQLHLANSYVRGLLDALPPDFGRVARWVEIASMKEIFRVADIALTNFIGADLRHADLSYDTPLSGIRWSARAGSPTRWPEEWVARIREMSEEEEAGSDIYVIRNDWRHAEDNLTLRTT